MIAPAVDKNELAFRATFRQTLTIAKRLITSRVTTATGDLRKLMAFALQHQTPSEYPFVLKYAFCRRECDGKKILKIAAAVHLLQQSTFVTDDIFDSAELRYRNRPIYLQYDVNSAIIAAELLQAIALCCVAEQLERCALEFDPLSLPINATAGDILIRMQKNDQAIAQLHKTIELDVNFPLAHSALRNAYEYKHMFNEAIGEHEAAAVAQGYTPEQAKRAAAALREAYAKSGEAGYWRARVQLAQQNIRHGTAMNYDESPFRMASLYARIGNTDSAVQWLERAFDERDISLVYVRTAPEFQEFRSDPRIVKILQQMGLPK
jgi:tetratricopeptide (TPR) repeat protein